MADESEQQNTAKSGKKSKKKKSKPPEEIGKKVPASDKQVSGTLAAAADLISLEPKSKENDAKGQKAEPELQSLSSTKLKKKSFFVHSTLNDSVKKDDKDQSNAKR